MFIQRKRAERVATKVATKGRACFQRYMPEMKRDTGDKQFASKQWLLAVQIFSINLSSKEKESINVTFQHKRLGAGGKCYHQLSTCFCMHTVTQLFQHHESFLQCLWFCNLGNAFATVNVNERGQGTAYHTWHSLTMEVQWLIVSSDIDIWQCNS